MKTAFLIAGGFLMLAGTAHMAAPAAGTFTNSVGMEMVRIEPGSFAMGADGSRDEWVRQPVHDVTLTKPFHISATEVTLEQYRRFRKEFEGTPSYAPYVAGVSWYDAEAFAKWLSKKEGRPYRLPTEAEWEYVARGLGGAEAGGVQHMLSGVREWCHDWFAAYPRDAQTDPVGPATGSVRIVRGGPLDIEERNFLEISYAVPEARLAVAPSFGPYPSSGKKPSGAKHSGPTPGLVGVWYDETDFTDPQESTVITRLSNTWTNDPRGGGNWSARWRGYLESPVSGEVRFTAEAGSPFKLEIDGETVIDGWQSWESMAGAAKLVKGQKHSITVSFARYRSDYFHLYWSWGDGKPEVVPSEAISFDANLERQAKAEAKADMVPGQHAIGFRLVLGELPATAPLPVEPAFDQVAIKQGSDTAQAGPDLAKPYLRKRYLFPTPLENSPNEAIDAVGMPPSFRRHNHSPGVEVLENGDVILVIYTSYREYEPGVSLIATRLRHGADQWDMPSTIADFVGLNDHAPLFWNDGGTLHLFWGSPKLGEGAFPFQWMSSKDNGATWGEVRFPNFTSEIGSHSRQPINTAFRDAHGRMHLSSDGSGGESVLWASDDDGATWFDTGGRSAGRHTSFGMLKDGRILAMGGKSTHIDGFMPKAISSDRGRTYEASKTPFARLGSNQRPTLIRLQSGRLFFAGDFVYHNDGSQPAGIDQLGSYVALSEDEGETWRIKRLIGAQPHENQTRADRMKGPTLGYAVARQGANGMIHLIATMTNPCLHFELNEAWILDGPGNELSDRALMAPTATSVAEVRSFEERYPSGKLAGTWSGGIADDGHFVLQGPQTWYHEDGSKQWEVRYELGRKTGSETYWSEDGKRLWSWEHAEDGTSVWTQYWPNGQKKAESTWRDFKADGKALRWSPDGTLVGEAEFDDGALQGDGGHAMPWLDPSTGRVLR